MTTVKRQPRPSPLRAVLLAITIPILLLVAFLTLRTPSKTTADIRTTTTTTTTSSIHENETERVTMGFTKTILKVGNGLKPERGQSVTVHCTFALIFSFLCSTLLVSSSRPTTRSQLNPFLSFHSNNNNTITHRYRYGEEPYVDLSFS
jgi:hypothetical protein